MRRPLPGVLTVAVILAVPACVAIKSTPAQERAQAAWDACATEGRIPSGLQLSRIDDDGRVWFSTANDGTIGFGDLRVCLAEKINGAPR
jgi:streptogramin lyase